MNVTVPAPPLSPPGVAAMAKLHCYELCFEGRSCTLQILGISTICGGYWLRIMCTEAIFFFFLWQCTLAINNKCEAHMHVDLTMVIYFLSLGRFMDHVMIGLVKEWERNNREKDKMRKNVL